ncbi:MAG: hypothetical protein AABX03_00765 [Nanoarchaeota archaeon]
MLTGQQAYNKLALNYNQFRDVESWEMPEIEQFSRDYVALFETLCLENLPQEKGREEVISFARAVKKVIPERFGEYTRRAEMLNFSQRASSLGDITLQEQEALDRRAQLRLL